MNIQVNLSVDGASGPVDVWHYGEYLSVDLDSE